MRRVRRRRLARVGIAAAILFPVILLFSLLTLRNTPQGDISDIGPGTPRATLTLADGTTIELGTGTNELSSVSDLLVYDEQRLLYNETMNHTPVEPETHRLSVPRGGEFFLRLPDGTAVWLNSETELLYPSFFTGGSRSVTLKGEAYFAVKKNEITPFVVESTGQRVTVLGTSFSVRAYEHTNTLTTLESGRVRVEANGEAVELEPGNQSVTSPDGLFVRNVDTSLYTGWHSGRFIFRQQTLGDILSTLSRWYDIDVEFEDSRLANQLYTGELQRYSNIGELLSKIETLEKVTFSVKGDKVIVSPYR